MNVLKINYNIIELCLFTKQCFWDPVAASAKDESLSVTEQDDLQLYMMHQLFATCIKPWKGIILASLEKE